MVDLAQCGNVCPGESGLTPPRLCGGNWRNAVYGPGVEASGSVRATVRINYWIVDGTFYVEVGFMNGVYVSVGGYVTFAETARARVHATYHALSGLSVTAEIQTRDPLPWEWGSWNTRNRWHFDMSQ